VVPITPKLLKNIGPIPAVIAAQLRWLTLREDPERLAQNDGWLNVKAHFLRSTLGITEEQLLYRVKKLKSDLYVSDVPGAGKLKITGLLKVRPRKIRWSSDYLLDFKKLEQLGGTWPTPPVRTKRRRRRKLTHFWDAGLYWRESGSTGYPSPAELLFYKPILHEAIQLACADGKAADGKASRPKDITPAILLDRMLYLAKHEKAKSLGLEGIWSMSEEPKERGFRKAKKAGLWSEMSTMELEWPAVATARTSTRPVRRRLSALLRADLSLTESKFRHGKVPLKNAGFLEEGPPDHYRFDLVAVREYLDQAREKRAQTEAEEKRRRAEQKAADRIQAARNREERRAEYRKLLRQRRLHPLDPDAEPFKGGFCQDCTAPAKFRHRASCKWFGFCPECRAPVPFRHRLWCKQYEPPSSPNDRYTTAGTSAAPLGRVRQRHHTAK
jgi:hypothetical protein